MMVNIICSKCKKYISVNNDWKTSSVTCPYCGYILDVCFQKNGELVWKNSKEKELWMKYVDSEEKKEIYKRYINSNDKVEQIKLYNELVYSKEEIEERNKKIQNQIFEEAQKTKKDNEKILGKDYAKSKLNKPVTVGMVIFAIIKFVLVSFLGLIILLILL